MKLPLEYRKVLKNDLIKLIVWIVLLFASFSYISYSRAELISITSTISVLTDKLQIFTTKLSWKDWQVVDDKQKILDNYQNLYETVKDLDCFSLEDKQKIQNIIKELKKIKYTDFKRSELSYFSNLSYFFRKLQTNCKLEK